MSAQLLGLAFKAEMPTHVAKLVLLKLVSKGVGCPGAATGATT
jgi:hypothetical protein